jgi:heme-degrading monooxygenase HmoA
LLESLISPEILASSPMPAATTPKPPYYAVIFTSQRTDGDNGYAEMARRMEELSAVQPGYLGIESVRGPDGFGITVSYWSDEGAIASWKADMEHREAQDGGRREWYAGYCIRIARVERAYGFARPAG